jgi:hypothetical protein
MADEVHSYKNVLGFSYTQEHYYPWIGDRRIQLSFCFQSYILSTAA